MQSDEKAALEQHEKPIICEEVAVWYLGILSRDSAGGGISKLIRPSVSKFLSSPKPCLKFGVTDKEKAAAVHRPGSDPIYTFCKSTAFTIVHPLPFGT